MIKIETTIQNTHARSVANEMRINVLFQIIGEVSDTEDLLHLQAVFQEGLILSEGDAIPYDVEINQTHDGRWTYDLGNWGGITLPEGNYKVSWVSNWSADSASTLTHLTLDDLPLASCAP